MKFIFKISLIFLIFGLLGTPNIAFAQEYKFDFSKTISPSTSIIGKIFGHELKGSGGGRGGGGRSSRRYGGVSGAYYGGTGAITGTSAPKSSEGWLNLITLIALLIPIIAFIYFLLPEKFHFLKKLHRK